MGEGVDEQNEVVHQNCLVVAMYVQYMRTLGLAFQYEVWAIIGRLNWFTYTIMTHKRMSAIGEGVTHIVFPSIPAGLG